MVLIAILLLQNCLPNYNPLQLIVQRQQNFLLLPIGTTSYDMVILQPTILSFVKALPMAATHSFLSPLPAQFSGFFIQLLGIEQLVYFAIIICYVCFTKKNIPANYFIIFSVVFSIFMLLFTGYIANTAGALVRYRSIYLPLLFMPLLASIDYTKIVQIKK